jgi:hypothetical protein
VYSRRVVELGAGLMADCNLPSQVAGRLFRLLSSKCFLDGAQAFKAQHAQFRSEASIQAIVGRLHRLAIA